MSKYIVEASSEEIFSTYVDNYNIEHVSQLVTCKECKFMEEQEGACALCNRHRMTTWYGGFCAWGERRYDG